MQVANLCDLLDRHIVCRLQMFMKKCWDTLFTICKRMHLHPVVWNTTVMDHFLQHGHFLQMQMPTILIGVPIQLLDPNATTVSQWYFTPDGGYGDYPQTRTEGAYRTGFRKHWRYSQWKRNDCRTLSAPPTGVGHMPSEFVQPKAPEHGQLKLLLLGTGTNDDTWSKMAESGEDVHTIWQATGTTGNPIYGQDGLMFYSHSSDGGQTWPTLRQRYATD